MSVELQTCSPTTDELDLKLHGDYQGCYDKMHRHAIKLESMLMHALAAKMRGARLWVADTDEGSDTTVVYLAASKEDAFLGWLRDNALWLKEEKKYWKETKQGTPEEFCKEYYPKFTLYRD